MANKQTERRTAGFRRVLSRSLEDFGPVEIISESFVGVMMAFFLEAVGVANKSEMPELILLCLGGAIITPVFGFLIRLIFISPQKIRKEDEAEIESLKIEIEALRALSLEIEPVLNDIKSAKWHPCLIIIHNKSSTQTADNVRVELVSLQDEMTMQQQATYFHPSFPVVLNPETSSTNTIHPGGKMQYRLLRISANQKSAIIKDGQIVGFDQKLIAHFNPIDMMEKNVALFQCQKKYRIKLAVTARDFPISEREFDLIFVDENSGLGVSEALPIHVTQTLIKVPQ